MLIFGGKSLLVHLGKKNRVSGGGGETSGGYSHGGIGGTVLGNLLRFFIAGEANKRVEVHKGVWSTMGGQFWGLERPCVSRRIFNKKAKWRLLFPQEEGWGVGVWKEGCGRVGKGGVKPGFLWGEYISWKEEVHLPPRVNGHTGRGWVKSGLIESYRLSGLGERKEVSQGINCVQWDICLGG